MATILTDIKVGDRVRTIGVPKNRPEYDDGIVVDVHYGRNEAHVAWRRAKVTYKEDLLTLEKM